MCVCVYHCAQLLYTTQNRTDYFPSYPADNQHSSDLVSDVVEKTSTRHRSRIPCVVVEKITTRRREGVGGVVEKKKKVDILLTKILAIYWQQ